MEKIYIIKIEEYLNQITNNTTHSAQTNRESFPKDKEQKLDLLDLFLIENSNNCKKYPNKTEELEEAINNLKENERLVLTYFYGLFDQTRMSVADMSKDGEGKIIGKDGKGISRVAINNLKRSALDKLIAALSDSFFEGLKKR